jgi:hypothetical protein
MVTHALSSAPEFHRSVTEVTGGGRRIARFRIGHADLLELVPRRDNGLKGIRLAVVPQRVAYIRHGVAGRRVYGYVGDAVLPRPRRYIPESLFRYIRPVAGVHDQLPDVQLQIVARRRQRGLQAQAERQRKDKEDKREGGCQQPASPVSYG